VAWLLVPPTLPREHVPPPCRPAGPFAGGVFERRVLEWSGAKPVRVQSVSPIDRYLWGDAE